MAIYLGHTTAQRILESKLVRTLDTTTLLLGPINCLYNKRDVLHEIGERFKSDSGKTISNPLFLRQGDDLDIIVSSQLEKRHWDGARFHVYPEGFPMRSFLQLKEGIFVASPELCFLQRAAELSLIETIKLAMSFCGIYKLVGDEDNDSIFDRKPIMTIDSAFSFLGPLDGLPGVKNARKALELALPMSGSPMETRMVMPFYLPNWLGGFGLPRPEMNKEIPLDEHASLLCEATTCRGDAVWEDGKNLFEYQSRENHDISEQYGKDYARQLALEAMGYEVHFVTMQQMRNVDQVTELARIISRRTGYHLKKRVLAATKRRENLLESVLA